MFSTTKTLQPPLAPPFSARQRPKWTNALRRFWHTLGIWQERLRQRHQLAGLSDRVLRDIAVSRVDALQEAGKPFWRE